MTAPDHLAHLSADVAAIDGVLQGTDLDTPVPDCGDWRLRDLVLHLGGVHRWAAQVVRTGEKQPQEQEPVADGDLRAWLRRGADDLRTTLADPERATWTFDGPGTAQFWRRRQAVETAVHRVDAQRVSGVEQPVPDDLAEDGVSEVVEVLHPRQVRLGRAQPATCSVRLVAGTGRAWLLGQGPTCATVTGTPSDLLLLLWRRERRRSRAFTVEGDTAALDALLGAALTP